MIRKAVVTVFAVFALAAGATALVGQAQAGFTVCTYRCICSVPHLCCGTACKPAPNGPLQCPQVNNC
jgi:hypothetical protein